MWECECEGGLGLEGLSLEEGDDGLEWVSNSKVDIVIIKKIMCLWCFIFN